MPREAVAALKPYMSKKSELMVEWGCVLWGIRAVVPERWRERLLSELYRDHPGIVKMKSLARSYMWWPGMDASIDKLAKSCPDCQEVATGSTPTAMGAALSSVSASSHRFCRPPSRVLCF